jgi:hypothetical protein
MALFTYRKQVAHPVGMVMFEIADMVDMQDRILLEGSAAYLTGMIISCEHCISQCLCLIPFSLLVICTDWDWIAFNSWVSNSLISKKAKVIGITLQYCA